jgi:hypothetical protein
MTMHPTQRVRAALHKPIGSMGTFAEDSGVVLPMLPETDGFEITFLDPGVQAYAFTYG